jgi:anti-sigma regulatory factor (Ser/Thr protein kinase)
MGIVDAWLTGIPSIASQRTTIGTITTELLTNAVDHGLLGLDSCLKAGPGGFGAYYEERERRLQALTRGVVRVELGVECVGSNYRLNLMVEDSGRGFDPRRLEALAPEGQLFGRGLTLVRSLCRDLRVVSPGNRTEVVYEWSAADATLLARTA